MNKCQITTALTIVANYDTLIYIYTECLLIKESTKEIHLLSITKKRNYLISQINITTEKPENQIITIHTVCTQML